MPLISYRATLFLVCIFFLCVSVVHLANNYLGSGHRIRAQKYQAPNEMNKNAKSIRPLGTPEHAIIQESVHSKICDTTVHIPMKAQNSEAIRNCRAEFFDFIATLANALYCNDSAWHSFAVDAFCGNKEQLQAQFSRLQSNPTSDFAISIDISPLKFDKERDFRTGHSELSNVCYRTLASLSDSMSQNVERNKCSSCSSDNHLLSYCYYLLFRAASLLMSVSRPSEAIHVFSIPISRADGVDSNTWVTGEYPKRVAQSLISPGSTEYFNFHVLKQVLSDCRSDIVVNIGANDGFYTFSSSVRGCRTISFEPQVGCLQNLYFSAIFPIYPHLPLLYNSFVSDSNFSVESGTSCDGGAQFTTKGARTSNTEYSPDQEPWTHPGGEKVNVKSMRLEDAVNDDIRLLLIDVEGAEVSVLNACESLLDTKKIHHAIIEWTVDRWSRFGVDITTGSDRAVAIAKKAGWECRLLDSTEVVSMPSSNFRSGNALAGLFSSRTDGILHHFYIDCHLTPKSDF